MIDTTGLKEIYVVGRPRSGTVWLNRLVADALDSPLQVKSPNAEAPVYCGPGRDGGYVVRKAHGEKKFAPTVFIQRDPRDVAVSTMYYRHQTDLFPVVKQMCEPHSTSYEYHIRMWLDDREKAEVYTRYERLKRQPVQELRAILLKLIPLNISLLHVENIIKRQSFAAIKAADTEGRYAHSMRKGVVGDWRKHFTWEIGQYMQKHMGNLLIEQNYVQERHWWKELNE